MSGPPKNLLVALQLAEAGIDIFPADARKRPTIADWDENSSADPDCVRRWWRIRPDALVAIDLRKSNLLVVDADRHGGPDGVAAFGDLVHRHGSDLSRNPVVRTPSGGAHIYFTQPEGNVLGNRRGALPAGIDVRGAGGYVIAPGCVRTDGSGYTIARRRRGLVEAYSAQDVPPAPPWLAETITALPTLLPGENRMGEARSAQARRHQAYAAAAMAKIVAMVAAFPTGGRNNALNGAAFRLGGFVARRWISQGVVEAALVAAAEANGLLREDGLPAVKATIASGMTAGMMKPAPDPRGRLS